MHGLRAENEALEGRLKDSAAKTVEKAEEERDQGQREAMLLATQRQLRDSLTRAQHEVRTHASHASHASRWIHSSIDRSIKQASTH